MAHAVKRKYDHHLKLAVSESGNTNLFRELKIPRTTSWTWIKNGVRPVEGANDQIEVATLHAQIRTL